jgi:hypothetical protein
MLEKLNQWQRFWVLFAGVFLLSTFSMIALLWPQRDPGMAADLRAPECQEWREIPDGVFPDRSPELNEPCHSIRSFLYKERVTVRAEDDYDGYLAGARVKAVLMPLSIWAAFVAGTYLIGMLGAWGAGKLRKDKKRATA